MLRPSWKEVSGVYKGDESLRDAEGGEGCVEKLGRVGAGWMRKEDA